MKRRDSAEFVATRAYSAPASAGGGQAPALRNALQRLGFDETWRAFRGTPLTLGPTPGVREAWHRGRPHYAVWLLRIDDPRVHRRMADVATGLGSAIEVVPGEDAHVTVFVAGFPTDQPPRHDDDVSERALGDAARAVACLGAASPRLAIRGANAFATCAFLEVATLDETLDRLREALGATSCEMRFSPYLPHVTVGRFRATGPTEPIAAALERHREAPVIEVAPRALELVTFDARSDSTTPLVTRSTIPFRPVSGARAPRARAIPSP